MRNPYDAHLCAQDPEAFKCGFDFAEFWVRHLAASSATPGGIYQAIKRSSGVPFSVTAAVVGLPPIAKAEGLMLGVYGLPGLP